MKNKKLMMLISIIVVAVIGVVLFITFKNNENNNDKSDKYFTITFDTDDGSKIENIKVKENSTIKLPDNPIKEGYEFQGWTIKNQKFDKNMKVTKDITLIAVWSKLEANEKDEELNNNDEDHNDEVDDSEVFYEPTGNLSESKNYTCENGYTLNGTKCIKTYSATATCPSGLYEINGQCVQINVSKKIATIKTCKTGTKVFIGYDVCKADRIGVDSQSSCDSAGGQWFAGDGCYSKGEMSYSCQNGYEYISNPKAYVNGIHGEAGCYPIGQYTYSCANSNDKLDGTQCISTIAAKLQ